MADLATVERAFMNAHNAGDTQAAGVLAREVKRLRAMPKESAVVDQGDPLSPKSNRELSWADTGMDAAKSFGSGLVRGAAGLVGMPGDISNLTIAGLGKLNGQSPEEIARIQSTNVIPGSADITGAIERNITGPLHESRSTTGDYAGTIGEFAPSVLAGPGGVARKAAMTVIPAVATQAAGDIPGIKGSAAEPYVRAGAAILTGGATAGFKTPTTNKILRDASKTSKAMQQAKDAAYKQAEETVGKEKVSLKEFADIVRGMNKEAVSKGVGGALSETTDKLYVNSKSIVSDMSKILQGAARGERPPPTYGDLEQFRQTLNDVVEDSKDIAGKMSKDGYLASRFIDKLDEAIDKTPFQEARVAYKTLRKTQRIERAIADAETRSSSTDLAYKNEFKKILRENIKRPIFSKSEVAALRQVAGHGTAGNILQMVGKLGFTKSSTFTPLLAAGGVASGLGIPAGIATAVGATAARAVGTKLTKSAAERARNIVSQGGDNAALDAKLEAANAARLKQRTAATVNAEQQSADKKRKPVRLKNGSIYWNPAPSEYQRLISSGEATPL